MKEIQGDIWDFYDKGYWIVITTNGSIKKNGEAVMGRGTALQAKQRFPTLPKELGYRLREHGNNLKVFFNYRIITFPVKDEWMQKASLTLIDTHAFALKRLVDYSDAAEWAPVYLARPGCGNGRLDWKDVRPILERYLDDRFVVVERSRL